MAPRLEDLLQVAEVRRSEFVNLAQRLIQADTENDGTPSSGNETRVVDVVESTLAGYGVILQRLAHLPHRANLIVRLKGRSGRARLALLSHSDVVPAGDLANWNVPPFAGTVSNGRLYGRGAADMKGIMAAQIAAMKILARCGAEPEHDLTLICAADEEAGGDYGMRWLTTEHPEKVRTELALNEGGGACWDIGGVPYYGLCFGEKGRLRVTFRLRGKGAHASRPWEGENALHQLGSLLAKIQNQGWTPVFDQPFFAALSRLVGWEDPLTPITLEAFLESVAALNPDLASQARASASHTLTPTVVAGGSASNSVPDSVTLTCDMRLVPGLPIEEATDTLREFIDGFPGGSLEMERVAVPTASPENSDFLQAITSALGQTAGREMHLLPSLTTGFTDARFLRELGVIAYNFAPGAPGAPSVSRNVHGPNEFTLLEDLFFRVRFYLAVALKLLW